MFFALEREQLIAWGWRIPFLASVVVMIFAIWLRMNLKEVQGVDLQRYADQLIARYRNPALRHRTWQIAMDGSQKLPQRMLDSVRWHLHRRQRSAIAGYSARRGKQ